MISKLNHIEENGPQPIETAPKDGTVILSDCGLCKWGDCEWVLCSPVGAAYREPDRDGWDNATCEPKFWTPKPDWIRGES